VKRITVWDRTLTDEEAAKESECRLSVVGEKCADTITALQPYSRKPQPPNPTP